MTEEVEWQHTNAADFRCLMTRKSYDGNIACNTRNQLVRLQTEPVLVLKGGSLVGIER